MIDPHEDTGRYAKAYSRFHLVLTSAPGNTFTCDNQTVHMQPGELWWFNHRGEHSVRNDSDTDRIHLIFDAQVPGFAVRELSSVQANPAAGIRIVEAPLADRIDRMAELLHAHWDEVAKNKQVMVLKPDRERYAYLDEHGGLLCLWALDADGEIVGYSVNFIGPHIHYADLTVANNDVLFLREDLRPSTLGLRLIRETERAAKARGAQLMLWLRRTNPWFMGALCASMAVSLAGVFWSAVPTELVNAAQLFIGTSLGVGFRREFLHTAPRWLTSVGLGTAAMLGLSALFGWGMATLVGQHPATLILGTSPGGIAEMAITAKVLQLGVPVVTAFQVCRLVAVLVLVAPLFDWLERKGHLA